VWLAVGKEIICESMGQRSPSSRARACCWDSCPVCLNKSPLRQIRLPAPSSAVEDIIKLSRADISEAVILNFIDTSGTLYDLKPRDVIRLRDEGVKDSVINAMIDQRRKFETNAAPTIAPEPAPAPAVQTPCPVSCNLCGGPMYCKREPISTVYVIPYSSSRPAYASYGMLRLWLWELGFIFLLRTVAASLPWSVALSLRTLARMQPSVLSDCHVSPSADLSGPSRGGEKSNTTLPGSSITK
jgi:hypothetical protein